MTFRELCDEYPAICALFPNRASFYRVLHYSIVEGGIRPTDGTGHHVEYSRDDVQIMALRRLLGQRLGMGEGGHPRRSINPALAEAMFDPHQHTVEIFIDGCRLSLDIPDGVWSELVVPSRMLRPA